MNSGGRKILIGFFIIFVAATVLVCGIIDMPGQQVLGAAWLAAVSAGVVGVFVVVIRDAVRSATERRTALRQIHRICVMCGYDLRATHARCPECGTPISVPKAADPQPTPCWCG